MNIQHNPGPFLGLPQNSLLVLAGLSLCPKKNSLENLVDNCIARHSIMPGPAGAGPGGLSY